MRDLRIACGQFEPRPADKPYNLERMGRQAAEAAAAGAEWIVFPELTVSGYLPPEQIPSVAEPLSGESVRALARIAAASAIGLAFGFAEKDEKTGRMYNSLVVLDQRGERVAVYHKVHLWDTEKRWASPGDGEALFAASGIPTTGWICYDTRFPELARLAALQGAELALVPTAWLGPTEEWELALRARALDNALFVAGADTISRLPGLLCRGASLIVGPHGEVLARAEPGREMVIHAVLSKESFDQQRGRVPLKRDRRPALYRRLAEEG